jgi:hypothetical protein
LSGLDDLLLREPQTPDSDCTLWKSLMGSKLRVPSLDPAWVCVSEDPTVEFTAPGSPTPVPYRSRVAIRLQGSSLWKRRRGPSPPPFPDASGLSTPTPRDETEEESEEREAEESAETAERQGCAPSALAELHQAMSSGTLSIYEQALAALPESFKYVPRVKGEDAAADQTGTLDLANDVLVSGMMYKKRRLV